MPVDMVVYTTIFTLVVFLLFRFPGVWPKLELEGRVVDDRRGTAAAAIALAATGLLTLLVQFLMAPTHTIGGINYADVWHAVLSLLGAGLVLAGITVTVLSHDRARRNRWQRPRLAPLSLHR